ncbi:hypothetical protein, partial, partial [Absidia glauca]
MGKISSVACPICLLPTKTANQRAKHINCGSARRDQPGTVQTSSQQNTIVAEQSIPMVIDMEDQGEFDFDFGDGPTTASMNSGSPLTELIAEPKTYDGNDFGDPSGALAISEMLYSAALKNGVTQKAYRAMVTIINDHIIPAAASDPDFKVHSAYKSKKAMEAAHPVNFARYASCKVGCMMFQDGDQVDKCRYCSTDRPPISSSTGLPASYVTIPSISDIIASKLYHPATRSQLLHRSQRVPEVGKSTDIFDGSVYKEMVEGGYFDSPYDVAVTLGIDGFQPFDKGYFQATIVNMTILNIDPKNRSKKHNLIQIMIIPGVKKPRDLESFLSPMLQELDHLSRVGIKIRTADEGTLTAKVHLMAFTGDIPAIADLIRHSGHHSYNGCRICVLRGVRGEIYNPGLRGMYFPGDTSLHAPRQKE